MPSITGSGMNVDLGVVTTEKTDYTGTVTSSPIEGGQSVNDHYIFEPPQISLSGVVIKNGNSFKAAIEEIMESGTIVKYNGRNILSSVVVTKFSPTFNAANANGFSYTMTLRYVRLSSAEKFSHNTGLSDAVSAGASNSYQNAGTTSPTTVGKDSASVAAATAAANNSSSVFKQ